MGLVLPAGRGWAQAQGHEGHECHEWRWHWPCPEPSQPGDSSFQALRKDKQENLGSWCPDYPSAITEGNKMQSALRVSPGRPILPDPASVKVTAHILKELTDTGEQKTS